MITIELRTSGQKRNGMMVSISNGYHGYEKYHEK
jgi:hypothetical protein